MRILRLLFPAPIEFDLAVDAAPAEVRRVLAESVGSHSLFGGPPFVGTLGETGFRIQPRVGGYHSFRPILHGGIEPSESGGTFLPVSVRAHGGVQVFVPIWFAFVLQFAVIALWVLISAGRPEFLLVSLGMLAFGYLIVRWGFGTVLPRETEAAKQKLLDVLGPLGAREVAGP